MDTETLSITITIENNIEYINEYYPDVIEYDEFKDEIISLYPYEFTMEVSKFKTVFCGLGVDISPHSEIVPIGHIEPEILLDLLDKIVPELCIRSGRCTNGILEKNIEYGFIIVLKNSLITMCEEAISRGELIVWE